MTKDLFNEMDNEEVVTIDIENTDNENDYGELIEPIELNNKFKIFQNSIDDVDEIEMSIIAMLIQSYDSELKKAGYSSGEVLINIGGPDTQLMSDQEHLGDLPYWTYDGADVNDNHLIHLIAVNREVYPDDFVINISYAMGDLLSYIYLDEFYDKYHDEIGGDNFTLLIRNAFSVFIGALLIRKSFEFFIEAGFETLDDNEVYREYTDKHDINDLFTSDDKTLEDKIQTVIEILSFLIGSGKYEEANFSNFKGAIPAILKDIAESLKSMIEEIYEQGTFDIDKYYKLKQAVDTLKMIL